MVIQKIKISEFPELSGIIPIVDVRSPSEFRAGHIPGAINIPLFDDKEREVVGLKYIKEGRLPAIKEGLKFTGPAMVSKLEQGIKAAVNGKLLVHCWRGGMRSEAMSWLFSLGGIEVYVLEGGYKSYRHHILENLSEKRKMIILGGMTGSSKTLILGCLKNRGQQVVDLEQLANHKGSAFGALGQFPQPTTEQFGNQLFSEINKINPDLPVWVEDESRNIGSVFLPDDFYLNMQEVPIVALLIKTDLRLPRLMEEYSKFPAELLIESILKISRRLGGDRSREAVKSIESGNISRAIEIVLFYYDKAYLFGLKQKDTKSIIYVDTDTDDIEINASKVLEAAGGINWDCFPAP